MSFPDFGLFMGWDHTNHTWALTELLRPLLFNANFLKAGEVQYRGVFFAGYVGIILFRETIPFFRVRAFLSGTISLCLNH